MKVLWFDTETTGLYGWKHDIIQFAYIVEIDNVVVEEDVFTMQPLNYRDAIDQKALDIHGMQVSDLMQFQSANAGHAQIIQLLNKYINKSDKNDKFTPACYNAKFDMDFLQANFKKHNSTGFGSYFDYHAVDPMVVCNYLSYLGVLKLPDVKLKTVAGHFGIEFNAHDAMEDIRATRLVSQKLNQYIKREI